VQPLYVQVHPSDNVAIIVNPEGLARGTSFSNGLTLSDHIPQSHKVALHDLEQGAPIVRYGQIIGHAQRADAAGSGAEEMIDLPAAGADDLPLAPRLAAGALKAVFAGCGTPDGSVERRISWASIPPTMRGANGTLRAASARALPRFPAVDDVVAITHSYGTAYHRRPAPRFPHPHPGPHQPPR
jgi:galactarate dehydratase